MGRGKTPRGAQAKRLTLSHSSKDIEVKIKTSTTITYPGDGSNSKDVAEQKKIIKLVDVVVSTIPSIYAGQAITVTDGEVYAKGIYVGRVPERTGVTQGNGKIHKLDSETGEVWIKI